MNTGIIKPAYDYSEGHESLFTWAEDRQKTMLAYEAQYFPYWQIGTQHGLVFQDTLFMGKDKILARCNDELTEIFHLPIDRRFPEKSFVIRWAYGAIPTRIEWDKLGKYTVLIADYRISPLIADGGGRVCLLSMHDRGYYEKGDQVWEGVKPK